MANSRNSDDQTTTSTSTSPGGRGRWRFGFVLLVLVGAGSAAAFHYLKRTSTEPSPEVEYEETNVDEAAAKAQAAATQVQNDKIALETAQTEFNTAKAAWEEAKKTPQNTDELADATKKYEDAASRFEVAEDKLKTDDQRREEAEAERRRVEKLAAQEKANHKGLLGKWKRSDYYGGSTLKLKEDGSGMMVIDFNFGTKFVVGTDRLEIDIKWRVANGDHVIFDSLRGRPDKAFQYVTVTQKKGTHRDEVLIKLDKDSFTTQDAHNASKIKTWTRIAAE